MTTTKKTTTKTKKPKTTRAPYRSNAENWFMRETSARFFGRTSPDEPPTDRDKAIETSIDDAERLLERLRARGWFAHGGD